MSLFSLLNEDSQPTSATGQSAQLAQQIAALKAASGTTTSSAATATTDSVASVLITLAARRAASEAGDADKTAEALAQDIRTELDSQEADGHSLDLSGFSGRALSTIALNGDGSYSRAEVVQAKAELRERDRQSALALIGAGELTSESLLTYGKSLLAARASMSEEERALRDADPNLR
jgi:hypothetical protein